jgi:hypothetical protein
MPRLISYPLALSLGLAAALGLLACGGSGEAKLLPGGSAAEITSNLNRIKQMAAGGECVGAHDAAQQVVVQIDELGGVDKRLKEALREGATRLDEVIASDCVETTESLETTSAPAEGEDEEHGGKPKKSKGQAPPAARATAPSLPPQSKGKGKGLGNGHGEGPPTTPPGGEAEGHEGPPSGGVGAAKEAGGGG